MFSPNPIKSNVVGNRIDKCYNISAVLSPLSKEDAEFLAHIYPVDDQLQVTFYGCQTKKCIYKADFTNAKQFIADIPKIFDSKIKAVILLVFDFKNKNYPNNIKFCETLKAKLDRTKIPYYFLSNFNCMMIRALKTANITVNVGETIMIVFSDGQWARIFEYTQDGYKLVQKISNKDMAKNGDLYLEIWAGIKKSQKVIITTGKYQQRFINILKSRNPVLCDITDSKYDATCLMEIMKAMLDKSYTKFHVLPVTARNYFIGYEFGEKDFTLIDVPFNNLFLPLESTNGCSKTCFNHFLAYMDFAEGKLVKHKIFHLDQSFHEYKITITIDANNFPTYEVENIIHEHIVNFPKFCDNYKAVGIDDLKTYQIIGILANRSFVCVCKDGNFTFLKSWGGQWGKQMHISFDKKKPQFGEHAEETLAKHGRYGVQDLLQIMTEGDKAGTEITPHGYTFTKNDTHPVLIEFDTFDGKKSAAAPEFLVAMLLKEHLIAIKNETSEKPTSLGFFENVIHEHIENFPKFCDNYKAVGIDNLKTYLIIGILANRSFLCICKDGNFQFLESWGGQWGKQMHISFDKKKPQFGEHA
uniref:Peptidase C1A papain C-terminal domain-containing protein n=1 Tax=Panagrolaimus sp. ES5 TaxID=591445 RepID=A0AC34FPK0_9BILA